MDLTKSSLLQKHRSGGLRVTQSRPYGGRHGGDDKLRDARPSGGEGKTTEGVLRPMAEARGRTGAGEPRRVPYRVMRGAELVPTRSDVRGPWNECVFERVAREVDDGSRTI